jgi:hypothetical protein
MSVTVIENFVSQEDCKTITSFFDTICNPHPSLYGYTTTSGFETSNQASRLSMESPILPISGNLKEDEASLLLTSYVLKLKKEMEKAYDQKISLVNCNYVQMTTGANNGLHSDSTDLDGVQLHDKEELEFSALMYFNNYGVDFTGGQIIFPKENLNIKPKAGTAVFFKGDIDHIHAVQTVKSGSRKNAVMFFSKYQNTSDRMLFNDEHSGVPKNLN